MGWQEDPAPFLADFAVEVRHGGRRASAILDAPTTTALGGLVNLEDYQLTLLRADLPDLAHGNTVAIDGTDYVVAEVLALDDGRFKRVTLRPA